MEAFYPIGNQAASARVSAAGALVPAAGGVGVSSVTHTAASGVYLLNIPEGFRATRDDSLIFASQRYDSTGAVADGDEPNVRVIGAGEQIEVRTFVAGTLTDAPFTLGSYRRSSGGMAAPQNDGVGKLILGANISATGVVSAGSGAGIAGVVVATNVFAIGLVQGYGIPIETSDIKATVTGAVPGKAIAVQTNTNAIAVVTFNAGGDAVALPFSLSVRVRQGGGRRRGPAGNTILAALTDVVATVPALVGQAFGVGGGTTDGRTTAAAPVRTGAGVFEYTVANPYDPLTTVVRVQPASETSIDSLVTAEMVSSTLLRVRTFDAATPADRNHYVTLERAA